MKDKYVFDSSIWIEIERKNPAILKITHPLINQNQVCVIDVIVTELLRGIRTNKDFVLLKDVFSNFTQLSTSWEKISPLAFQVAKRGYYPPLIDLYIALCVINHKKALITMDKHFVQIASVIPFNVNWIERK